MQKKKKKKKTPRDVRDLVRPHRGVHVVPYAMNIVEKRFNTNILRTISSLVV